MSRDPRCVDCPLADRRAFLRDAVAFVFAALTGVAALPLAAQRIRLVRAQERQGDERAYPIPQTDGATFDKEHQVILVRFEHKAYAFALSCPHQNTALHWQPDDARFQCPKHKSRYRPDGVFISGRATRSMDRYAVRRDGAMMLVNVNRLYRQDRNAADWEAACVALSE